MFAAQDERWIRFLPGTGRTDGEEKSGHGHMLRGPFHIGRSRRQPRIYEDRSPPIWAPFIVDVVGEIQKRQRSSPDTAVLLCKRDIEGDSDRIFTRPDLSKSMTDELDGALTGLAETYW